LEQRAYLHKFWSPEASDPVEKIERWIREEEALQKLLAMTATEPAYPGGAPAAPPPPPRCGPEAPHFFWWQDKRFDLHIEDNQKEWKLLVFLWGKPVIPVSEIAKNVWNNKIKTYDGMKTAICRLNDAMMKVQGALISWGKKRGENSIIYQGPAPDSSVSD
jgi:hypothetical protein